MINYADTWSRTREELLARHAVDRLWKRAVTLWTADASSPEGTAIANRLGWLDAPDSMRPHVAAVTRLAEDVRREGFTQVWLLGMGGSSLCAEVLRSVCGVTPGYPSVAVLDTTDERTISAATGRLDPDRTLFIVSSKSGGTIEVSSLREHFWRLLSDRTGRTDAGRHFVAITDPGTVLQRLAVEHRYRRAFLNPPDIGGRFSALSLFGLVPAALMGIDIDALLTHGATLAAGCREERPTNPGLELGAFMGATALAGRDKLTVILPPSLRALGLWIEQLVAESTGKQGKGILPVVDDPLGRPDEYGTDRAFVIVTTDEEGADEASVKAVSDAGHPVLRVRTRRASLGAEFFRWEFATALAGAVLRVNPFDEPNVKEAKDRTAALLSEYLRTGTLPAGTRAAQDDETEAYSSRFVGARPADVLRAAVDSLAPGDYLAVLSYLTPGALVQDAIDEFRASVRRRSRVATTSGVGPRYLHSTGQYHKGGPNRPVCVMITGEDSSDTPIPGAGYSFSVLERAQALGDFQALEAHGRRAVRIHLRRPAREDADVLRRLFRDASR